MWVLTVSLIGIVAIALGLAYFLMSGTSDKPKRPRTRHFHPSETGRWDDAGSDRRSSK